LLSVAVVTSLTVTIPDLKLDDPQGTSAFYLAQLFELQLNAFNNVSTPFIPDLPPSFASDWPAIPTIVNVLLFICLSLNLFSAMLALLLQQWTREYLMLTHSLRSSSEFRARVREVFGGGLQKSPISSAVRVSMNLLFLSVFFFFSPFPSIFSFSTHRPTSASIFARSAAS
jgi:Family of unknown function (DUF6535)